ncbi:hypothetical protein PR048_000109 [Dryococelus australis]|uniref:Uncharacterized protein n=1 Tax=Dryococelus australis TaxID=614101 RepID=A0ABQ9IEB2_9NEOP|nr:hypothetical protein PR048_000109 [Dryococelus australis]
MASSDMKVLLAAFLALLVGARSWEDSALGTRRFQETQQLGAKSQDNPGVEGSYTQDVEGVRSQENWAPLVRSQEPQHSGVETQNVSGARSGEEWALGAGLRVVAAAYRQCRSGDYLLACLQLRALKAADRALKTDRIPLLDGVELVNTGEARSLEAPAIDEDRLLREPSRLTSMLMNRVAKFFDTHSIRINNRKLFGDDNTVDEGIVRRPKAAQCQVCCDGTGARGKKNKNMGGLLLLGGMMKAGLLAVGLAGLAALAGTALLTAKIALVLASVVGLGKLLSHGGEKVSTYEVVKQPVHSGHEYGGHYGGYYGASGDGGGHYGRSLGDAHQLAYQGQAGDSVTQS